MALLTLLPNRCTACLRPGPSPCRRCWSDLAPAPRALHPPPGLSGLHALLVYEGAGRELVARLKYRNGRSALVWLASAMAGLLSPALRRSAVLTWAPTSAGRRRRRGFDHGELLARAVAASSGMGCLPLLERVAGSPQTGRPLAERRRDAPVFSARRAPPAVVVVDDVMTTGSTLGAAAAALRAGGAERVVGLVAACTPLKPTGVRSDH